MFIRCNNPLLPSNLGLTGAYIDSGSAANPLLLPPYLLSGGGLFGPEFDRAVGNGGNAQSRLEDSSSGEGGARCIGAVALLDGMGRVKGDRGVDGEILRDGEALTGVN